MFSQCFAGPSNNFLTVSSSLFYTSAREILTLLYVSSLKTVPLAGEASSPPPLPFQLPVLRLLP